jgi:hypothetical protein
MGKFLRSSAFGSRHRNKSGAQEWHCSQVPGAFLQGRIKDLHEYIQGCVAELVFNLDEVSISDWEDRKMKNFVARAAMPSLVRRYIMAYLETRNTFR